MQNVQQLLQRLGTFLLLAALTFPAAFISTGKSVYAVSSLPQNELTASTAWWDRRWPLRLPVSINAGGYPRHEYPVEVTINFTEQFNAVGQPGSPNLQSLRVVEVQGDQGDQIVNAQVPFQFDPATDYQPTTNAAGTLLFLLSGTTAGDATRTFHLYFASQADADAGFTPPAFPDQVVLSAATDEGQPALQIQTAQAIYLYQSEAGGFSSLLDPAGNDWINYHPEPAASAGGAYRGIPNMIYPEGGLHPGATGHNTTVQNDGPLKATIYTTVNSDDDAAQWQLQWDFFPTFARVTVLESDHDYWFLYEGTPGGTFEPKEDFVVRADGTTTAAGEKWLGDLPGEEWLYFADPNTDRALYLINHSDDSAIDSYRAMSDSGGAMTVFGFGRRGVQTLLTEANRVFTIGLVESTSYESVAPYIRGTYQPVAVSIGTIARDAATVPAQITIAVDAQPNAKRNFRFDGDLGVFKLDDPKTDDGDTYATNRSFTVAAGVYTVRQSGASGWQLATINCTPVTAAVINLATRTAQINLQSGQQVHCTFVNVKETTLRVQRLDGQSERPVTLSDTTRAVTASGQSNRYGKVSFTALLPGDYTLCFTDRQHCTPITLAGDQLTLVTLAPVVDDTTITNTPQHDDVDDAADDAPYEPQTDGDVIEGNGQPTALTVEEQWLNTPIFAHQLYLPFVSATTHTK